MKRIIFILGILLTYTACTNDVTFNDPSFQGIKDGITWRAIDARAILNPDGSMTVKAYTQYEEVTFEVASTSIGTYTFGVDGSNVASYTLNIDNNLDSYQTGIDIGSGELKVTESPSVSGKLSGTFKFRALNEVGEDVAITNGVIYSIPLQ